MQQNIAIFSFLLHNFHDAPSRIRSFELLKSDVCSMTGINSSASVFALQYDKAVVLAFLVAWWHHCMVTKIRSWCLLSISANVQSLKICCHLDVWQCHGNYQVIADNEAGLLFKNKRDRKVINVDPRLKPGDNSTRTELTTNEFLQVSAVWIFMFVLVEFTVCWWCTRSKHIRTAYLSCVENIIAPWTTAWLNY